MSVDRIIRNVCSVIDLDQEEIDWFVSILEPRSFEKKEMVLSSGEICRYQTFVIQGCLKIFYTDNSGLDHTVKFAIEDWWAGDLGSLVNQSPSDFNIQCLENSELAQIHFEDLQTLYGEVPRMERFFRIIIQRAFIASQKRIIHNFSLPAKDRYLQFRQMYPLIEQRVPQYMIASYLGITKEFLSKIRSQLILE